ncbi:MAG TPA: NAD-dependent epimerase/dehydratase family protein [Candidatus Nanoarchaeia archaeon]|nr:NAD-dependent epimerase/dehydratase family protein [Candidatus Nanoarchaeia archaeon]
MNKPVVVTGAGGFIGKHVVQKLIDKGLRVRALIRNPEQKKYFSHSARLEIQVGDIRNKQFILNAVRGAEIVVHLAAAKSDEADSGDINIIGSSNLITACERGKVKLIIHMSTMSTKIARKGMYASTKAASDELMRNSKILATILRPSIVYGRELSGVFGALVKFSRCPFVPVFGNGKEIFRPIHVDDLAEIVYRVISRPISWGREYDVCGPDPISFDKLIELINLKFAGNKRTRILHLPVSTGIICAQMLRIFMDKPPITESNILGSTQKAEMNLSPLFDDFDFVPRPIAKGLEEIKRDSVYTEELGMLYHYICPGTLDSTPLSEGEIERYIRAIKNKNLHMNPLSSLLIRNHWVLGPVDAASRLFYASSRLQKKLYIAFVLFECSPRSADFLLPRKARLISVMMEFLRIGFTSSVKIIIGLLLMLVPGFVKHHAN